MNKEEIEKRIEALKKERLHHEKMQLVLDGALQDCEHWLKSMESAESNQENKDEQP